MRKLCPNLQHCRYPKAAIFLLNFVSTAELCTFEESERRLSPSVSRSLTSSSSMICWVLQGILGNVCAVSLGERSEVRRPPCVVTKTWNGPWHDLKPHKPPTTIYNHLQPPQVVLCRGQRAYRPHFLPYLIKWGPKCSLIFFLLGELFQGIRK